MTGDYNSKFKAGCIGLIYFLPIYSYFFDPDLLFVPKSSCYY